MEQDVNDSAGTWSYRRAYSAAMAHLMSCHAKEAERDVLAALLDEVVHGSVYDETCEALGFDPVAEVC